MQAIASEQVSMKEALSYMDRCPIMGCVFDEIAQRIGFADERLAEASQRFVTGMRVLG
jgi:hypothetical protein